MPLSPAQQRKPIHTRRIVLNGYQRDDGLYDIEANLTDTKAYAFDADERGRMEAGEPLHGMSMRMTVDEDLLIVGFEAVTDYSPYGVCPAVATNFARLVGIQIRPGFLRAAAERVGGTHGCTHLRELLQQMATVAFQTIQPLRARREISAGKPALLNTCHAYASTSPVVLRRWPDFYTAPTGSATA